MKMKLYILHLTLLFSAIVFTTKITAQVVRYVTATGTGAGTSWADASGDLQGIINASSANDQVWVSKGTYYPAPAGNQGVSFSMKEGVKIYGSFSGSETTLADRTVSVVAANPSVLSGDIDKNNILDGGNSNSVINNTGNNLTTAAVLDGFTVSGGYGGTGTYGAGIYNGNSSPTIINCIFSGNNAPDGGGIFNHSSSPFIINCIFSGNNSSAAGGGIYNENSIPVISNCIFYGNNAAYAGGGIFNSGSHPTIFNCSFSGNSGAIGNDGGNYGTSSAIIKNSILWGDNSEIFNNGLAGSAIITNSIVQGGYGGTGNLNIDPQFVTQAAGNLRLRPFSCAIDAGDNSAIPSGITTDLAGNLRIYNGIVDMGAYEYQGIKQPYVYVLPVITTNNGLNFDGSNDFVSIASSTTDFTACTTTSIPPSVYSAITIAYWFKGTNIQSAVRFQDGNGYIVAGWTGNGSYAPVHILSNDGGTNNGITVGAGATDGKWHHIAMTWQQNTTNGFKSYLDGQLVAQRDAGNMPLPAISTLSLGSQGGGSEFMNGSLDEVQVWDSVLSQSAIQAGMNGNIPAPQAGLLMYYKFDHGIVNGNNIGASQLLNSANPTIYSGTLNNFALTGTTSNWVYGKSFQSIRYVKAGGTGGGTSWADASGDLQSMINASDSGNQVWVAGGTYYPLRDASGNATPTDVRTKTFTMKEGIKIYGGFAGTEAMLTDRTVAVLTANPSILSGDLDKNNVLDDGNSYHVILNNGSGLTNATILDGFSVSNGLGDGTEYNNGQSTYYTIGSGMFIANSSPTINNCIFSGNASNNIGGGIYIYMASPNFTNCTFSGNNSLNSGGGVCSNGGNSSFTNCTFSGNSSTYQGGGLYSNSQSNNAITNCTFFNNSTRDGGAISNDYASSNITNCTFYNNSSGAVVDNGLNSVIKNSIFWGNSSGISNYNGATTDVAYSIVQGGYAGTGNLNIDPQFVNPTAGDLRLKASSCAINTGSNDAIPAGVTTDLAGTSRIYNSGTVDMGAYEYQGAKQAYVPPAPPAITSNNGLNFDGTDDYVSLLSTNYNACAITPPAVTNAITIEYWFKGSNLQSAVRFQDGNNYIVAGWNGAGTVANQLILSNDGATSGIPVGAAATDGNWHHIAMTWQQNTTNGFKSYLDGQLVAQRDAGNTPLPAISTLSLGSEGGVDEFMNGTLDEVQVWDSALSQPAIQAGMSGNIAPQPHLLMYYKFDHGIPNGNNSGANQLLNSSNPNAYPGTLNNFALTGTTSNWIDGVIRPTATFDTSSSNPSCLGSLVKFTSTVLIDGYTNTPATTGTVTFTQGSTVLAGNLPVDASGHASFSTDTLSAGSHNIVATYNAPTGFSSSNGSVSQVVNARPTGIISGSATYCSGSNTTTNLLIAVTGTGTISGTLSNGSQFSGTVPTINVSVSPTVTTIYTIATLNDANCTAKASDLTGSATVTINQKPTVATITYSGNTSMCSGSIVSLTDAASGGSWSSSSAAALVNSSGTVTFATVSAATQVTIYYTVTSNGCSATAAIAFTVNPPLSVKTITGTPSLCGINGTTQLSDATTGGTWSSKNTNIATVVSTSGLVTAKAVGTDTIYYTVSSGGCTATAQTSITVNAGVTVAAITGNNQVIKGYTIQLKDTTKNGVWSSSNTGVATVSTAGLVKGIAAGSCTIYYTFNAGTCSSPASKSITVYNPLTATATLGKILCYGSTTMLTLNASGGSGGYQYSINGGKFQTGNTFNVGAGTYIIIITDQMANQFTVGGVSVSQPAPLSIKLVSTTNASSKTTSNGAFTVSGSGGTSPYQYSSNGGVSYQASGTFTALAAGAYKVSIKDANNCVALNYLTVNVSYGKALSLSDETLISNDNNDNEKIIASVYPNPTQSSFNLKLESNKDQTLEVRVMDILGHVLYHTTGSATGTYHFGDNFIRGTYIVEVVYRTGIKTLKIVKQ